MSLTSEVRGHLLLVWKSFRHPIATDRREVWMRSRRTHVLVPILVIINSYGKSMYSNPTTPIANSTLSHSCLFISQVILLVLRRPVTRNVSQYRSFIYFALNLYYLQVQVFSFLHSELIILLCLWSKSEVENMKLRSIKLYILREKTNISIKIIDYI